MSKPIRTLTHVVLLALASLSCASETPDEAPPETDSYGWEAMSPDDERSNTHLWIVARALDGLANRELASADRAVALMQEPSCRRRWHAGLLEADYRHEYNDGVIDLEVGAGHLETVATGATWESHFWDPDTGLNYKGKPAPVAKDESLRHAGEAKRTIPVDLARGCYELGLALHYFTDLTQPMHAANFTAIDLPITLHSNYEGYAMHLHAMTQVDAPVVLALASPEDVIVTTARRAKTAWGPLLDTIRGAYAERCAIEQITTIGLADIPRCWERDARLDELTRRSLRDAVQATATYLVALDLPAATWLHDVPE